MLHVTLLASTDFFTAVTTMGTNIYQNIMKILIIVGVIAALVAIFILIFTHDDKKVGGAKSLLFRICGGIFLACILGSVVTYLLALTNGYHFDTSQTAAIITAMTNRLVA